MRLLMLLLLFCVLSLATAQYDHQYSTTTPVPILKQIDRHNEDGSYSYGYEAADGSYKIESKYPTGEVYGKYGFVDDAGSVREIEYGATRRGFEPSGTGINVPPSTLTGNGVTNSNEPEDDGQYREDPSVYYTDPRYTNGERYDPVSKRRQQQQYRRPAASSSVASNSPVSRYSEYRQPPANPQPYYQPEYRESSAVPQSQYHTDYRPRYREQSQPVYENQRYQPAATVSQTRFQGHPASNIDLNAGSYTVNYKR